MMGLRTVCLLLVVGVVCSTDVIQEQGRVYQMGKFPYLLGYAGKAVNSKNECEAACAKEPMCAFGTYVTKDAETRAGYNYQKKAKAGECWLSETTHTTATACGVPCVGFRKVKESRVHTKENNHDSSDLPEDVCTKDIKTCWDNEMLSRISEKNCLATNPKPKECAARKCHFGKIDDKGKIRWGCNDRPTCDCDPAMHPSHFNQCHRDPWSRHIITTHLSRKFHTKTFEEGAQHKCAMISADVCKCCTCLPTVSVPRGYLDLGTESHPVPTDKNSLTSYDKVCTNGSKCGTLVGKKLVDWCRRFKGDCSEPNYKSCMALCEKDKCAWGSFVARQDVVGSSTCILSTSAAEVDASGTIVTKECPTDEACHSFSSSANSVDMLNSRAFVHTKPAVSYRRQEKVDYEKCQWDKKQRKCSAIDRSGNPGLTGIHKTIPSAKEAWCKSREKLGDNVAWTAGECEYGCRVIKDNADEKCTKAEDHFKMMNGANPCTADQYWDGASETCQKCKPREYQWLPAHFHLACNPCPSVKIGVPTHDYCRAKCEEYNTVCSNDAECGTLTSPDLEAHCKANPGDCTTNGAEVLPCTLKCERTCPPLWSQEGKDIVGEARSDYAGKSVAMSGDGMTVAVGQSGDDGEDNKKRSSGSVRIFRNHHGAWKPVGDVIHGENAGDYSGGRKSSVSLSHDGRTVAIGASYNHDGNRYAGHVRVFRESDIDSKWEKLGQDIDGVGEGEQSGVSVSLSDDGNTVAIGAHYANRARGVARVWHASGPSTDVSKMKWTQIGKDLDGEEEREYAGYSVSLSGNGKVVAVSAYYAHGEDLDGKILSYSGTVRIWAESEGVWTRLGEDIDGKKFFERSGTSVSISRNGKFVAIGAAYANGAAGHVRVYGYSNNAWKQDGKDIDDVAARDYSGYSVSLSDDGRTVAIGAFNHDGGKGTVRVYHKLKEWKQLGKDIDGEAKYDSNGYSVSISGDGKTVGIGAPYYDLNGVSNHGHVRVFKLE
eukprot:g5342.t1